MKNLLKSVTFIISLFFVFGLANAQYVNVSLPNTTSQQSCLNQYGNTNCYDNVSVPAQTVKYPQLCSVLTRTLQQGDSGIDVKRLQEVLKLEGATFLTNTGYYGPVTKNAVQLFQTRYGIYPVGKVGPQTLARMRLLWCTSSVSPANPNIPYNPYTPVPPVSPGLLDVSISPTSSNGNTITISWSSRNATSCKLNNENVDLNGIRNFTVYNETNFTIRCSDYYGVEASKTIIVRPNQSVTGFPSLNVTINPASAYPGQVVSVYWTSQNTSYCTYNGANVATSGTQQVTVTSGLQAFTVTCYNQGGQSVSSTVYTNNTVNSNNYNMNVQDLTGTRQLMLVVTGSTGNVPESEITRYRINWGDGTETNLQCNGLVYATGYTGYNTCSGGLATRNYYTSNGNYVITLKDQYGNTIRTLNYYFNGGSGTGYPAVISFTKSQTNTNSDVTLYWSTTGMNSCSLSGGTYNTLNVNTNGSQNANNYNININYTLTCVGINGQTYVQIATTGSGSTNSSVSITPSTTNISSGQSVSLTINGTNVNSCIVTGGTYANYNIPLSYSTYPTYSYGSLTVYPTQTTTYTFNCASSTSSGTVTGTATVTVGGTATSNTINSFSANYSGGYVTISWSGAGNNSCSIYRYSSLGPTDTPYYENSKILLVSNQGVNGSLQTPFVATSANTANQMMQITIDCGGARSYYTVYSSGVSGNYCPAFSNGLSSYTLNRDTTAVSNKAIPAYGKWYFEAKALTEGIFNLVGIAPSYNTASTSYVHVAGYYYQNQNAKYINKLPSGYVSITNGPTTGEGIYMVAVDMDNDKLYTGYNGVWANNGDPVSGIGSLNNTGVYGSTNFSLKNYGTIYPAVNNNSYLGSPKVITGNFNLGDQSFVYAPPTGYNKLCN